MPSVEERVVIEDIEHGLGGYTNYGCRCDTCTDSNRDRMRIYRSRKFAGSPLCRTPTCPRQASKAEGNGYCYVCGPEHRKESGE